MPTSTLRAPALQLVPPTAIALLLASALSTFAQDPSRMDAAVKAQVAGGRFMGSVLVARDGAVVFEKSRVVPALLAFQPLSLYMKFPVSDHGWRPFALRAGAAFGFTLLMALVFWRHYHKNLKPDHARQKEILRDLS